MSQATHALRAQLDEGWVFSAGCFDAWSAKVAEHVGFRSVHFSGGAFQFSQYAYAGITYTMPELVAQVGRITGAIDVPVFSDVDTGFGDVEDVLRTVREVERAGAAGIHIEDMPYPMPAYNADNRDVISQSEAVGRVKAAVSARTNPDFVIAGRSDSTRSFDDVVERCNLYLAAGADVAFPLTRLVPIGDRVLSDLPADERLEWYRRLTREIDGPVLTVGGPDHGHTVDELRDAGFTWVILPLIAFNAASTAMAMALREAVGNGTARGYFEVNPPAFDNAEFWKLLDVDRVAKNARDFG